MTATDELRRMLDERGVEWMPSVWSAKDETFYKVGEVGFLATELSSGRMKVSVEGYPTPEQAIEATLGRGTCHDVGKGWMWRCSECKCRLDIDRDYLPTMWVDGMADVPRFCPNCGRRVVSE